MVFFFLLLVYCFIFVCIKLQDFIVRLMCCVVLYCVVLYCIVVCCVVFYSATKERYLID